MSAEVLIMCTGCGRPQLATRPDCIGCGAKLPDAPLPEREPQGRDKLLQEFQPFLEADLGKGRAILLSHKRLEWRRPNAAPLQLELVQLTRAKLESRPVYESLLYAVVAGWVAVAAPWPLLQWTASGAAVIALAACLFQRRYRLALELASGERSELELGLGRKNAPVVVRIQSIWASLAPELERLGIPTEAP